MIWVAFAALGADLVAGLDAGSYQALSLYRHWFLLDNASLTAVAAFLQRQAGWLWDPAALVVLALPVWAIAFIGAAIALWRAGRRPRRKMFR